MWKDPGPPKARPHAKVSAAPGLAHLRITTQFRLSPSCWLYFQRNRGRVGDLDNLHNLANPSFLYIPCIVK
jgi:hypothetical protein